MQFPRQCRDPSGRTPTKLPYSCASAVARVRYVSSLASRPQGRAEPAQAQPSGARIPRQMETMETVETKVWKLHRNKRKPWKPENSRKRKDFFFSYNSPVSMVSVCFCVVSILWFPRFPRFPTTPQPQPASSASRPDGRENPSSRHKRPIGQARWSDLAPCRHDVGHRNTWLAQAVTGSGSSRTLPIVLICSLLGCLMSLQSRDV